jgi:hypothetical protein
MAKHKGTELILVCNNLGKVVLDKLGLDVEVYYTSEIEEDSLLVTSYHHGDTVTPLGDVTKLTETKVCSYFK